MPGSANDTLFRESFFRDLTWPVQRWFRELESKTRSDISPQGIIASLKLNTNVMSNFSNNCTVDSINNGINATVRAYGPGGPGTTWHQAIGGHIQNEIPALFGHASYSTQYWVYWDGTNYHISSSALGTLPDGLAFAGTLTTISGDGTGGTSGGGGARYQGGGNQR